MKTRAALLLGAAAFLLGAGHVFLAYRWVSEDRQPPGWDPAVHLSTAQDYREAWHEGRWLDLLLSRPRPGRPAYPPSYHYTLTATLGAEAPHRAVVWLNLAYLLVLLAAGGWIAWELGGSYAGAAAAVILGTSPALIALYREAFTDLALAAWAALAYALLLHSRLYLRPRWSVALGLCAGLALISKWSAAIYLLPAWCAGLSSPESRRNLMRASAAAAAVSFPWYLLNGLQMLPRIWISMNLGTGQGAPGILTMANWWRYPACMAQVCSWPGFLLLLSGAGLTLAWPRGRPVAGRVCVAAWLLFSYGALSLVPTKDIRYLLPAAPALAALGAAGLPLPALAASAGIALWQARRHEAPRPGDWHEQEVLREVSQRRDRSQPLADLCLLPNHRYLNSDAYGWLLRSRGERDIYVGCQVSEIPEWAEFVLAKSGDPGEFLSERTLQANRDALAGAKPFSSAFSEIRRWPLPDGSQAALFQARRGLPAIKGPRRIKELRIRSARLEDARLTPLDKSSYEVSAATATLDKLAAPVRSVRLRLDGARLMEEGGRLYVLSVGTVTLLSASLRWDELSQALSRRSGLPVSVSWADGTVRARLGRGWASIEAALTLASQDGYAAARLERLSVFGIGLPWTRHEQRWPLGPRAPNQPYAVRIQTLRMDGREARCGT